jgi:hypothetical protein
MKWIVSLGMSIGVAILAYAMLAAHGQLSQ